MNLSRLNTIPELMSAMREKTIDLQRYVAASGKTYGEIYDNLKRQQTCIANKLKGIKL